MNSNGNNDYKSQSIQIDLLFKIQQIIFNITQENLETSIEKTMELFDFNFPYSYNLIISNLVYSAFLSKKDLNDFYINYIKLIQTKEEKINKNYPKIIQIFGNYLSKNESQESYYLIEKMLEENLIDEDIVKNIKSKYFAHYKSEKENRIAQNFNIITKAFLNNFEELSKNNWELHKQLIKEGHNPNEIAKIIRNDEIEKLQEISSQNYFDFNQTIEPSLYERCSYVNPEYKNVTLIDYAAFFSAIKCFKYLLMNGSKIENTCQYAIAGGNIEIIHLCEQNHSSFEGSYEAAIIFHQNDIFKYIYEKKLEDLAGEDINDFGYYCITNGNYEILSFLEKEGMQIDEFMINESAEFGNIYLIKHFLQNNQITDDILVFSSKSGNFELVKYILENKEFDIDINASDICLFYMMINIII